MSEIIQSVGTLVQRVVNTFLPSILSNGIYWCWTNILYVIPFNPWRLQAEQLMNHVQLLEGRIRELEQQILESTMKNRPKSPPPLPSPTISTLQFTSTPNPIFLSRGKLHEKAVSANSRLNKSVDHCTEEEEEEVKCKKQRISPEDLLQQKALLRKLIKFAKPHIPISNDLNLSIEEEEGSLNTLMQNALKRKFANINDISSINESLVSDNNSEFSL